jgi:hypothetical protein
MCQITSFATNNNTYLEAAKPRRNETINRVIKENLPEIKE